MSTYDKLYQDFLQRLREARQRHGITQRQAAMALGRPQSYVSRCETGERRVDVVELLEFACLYRITPDELFPDIQEIKPHE